jgi:hypothetical protein
MGEFDRGTCYHRFQKKEKGSCRRCRFFDSKYFYVPYYIMCLILLVTGVTPLYWKIYDWRHKDERT